MKSDSEMIRSLLLWLLEEPGSPPLMPSGNSASLPSGKGAQANESSVVDAASEDADDDSATAWDPLDSEELGSLPQELARPDLVAKTYFDLGDIPVVQDRFQALLKRRLQTEIERRPPLFPWESEVQEYPVDLPGLTPSIALWLTQLRSLDVPAQLPDSVLTKLFSQCQSVAATPLQEGLKLIKAVEALFPDQPQTMNQLADMVLAYGASYRDTKVSTPIANLASSYEAANPQQKIALSMLAAQEILNHLNLVLSAEQPQQRRTWQTEQGMITVDATYNPLNQPNQVDINVHLPISGTVQLQGREVAAAAQRSGTGALNLGISDPQLGQAYTLQVKLAGADQAPLGFTLQVISETDDR